MLRNLAVLMSALVAMSAQAKDASTPEGKGKPAPAAQSPERKQRDPARASRPAERRYPLSPSAKPAQPDAGTDATTPDEPNDCGIEQSFFDEAPMTVAFRTYNQRPPAASPGQDHQPQAGTSPPEVWQAGRCDQKYIIQLRNQSKEPFEVKEAKVVGVDREVLNVIRVRSRVSRQGMSINIITVERAKNVSEPDYTVTFLIIGEDGQGFVLKDVKLP